MIETKTKLLPDLLIYREQNHEDPQMCAISSLMFTLADDRTNKESYSCMAFAKDCDVSDENFCHVVFDPIQESDPTIVFSTIVDKNNKIVENGTPEDSIRIYKNKKDAYNYVSRITSISKSDNAQVSVEGSKSILFCDE